MRAALYFVVVYNFFVLMLSQFGPVQYVDFDFTKVFVYVSAVLVAIVIGYSMGMRNPLKYPAIQDEKIPKFPVKTFKWMCSVALTGLIINFTFQIASGQANLDFTNLGNTYIDSYEGYEINSGNYSFAFIIYTMILMPSFISTIWGLYFFKNLTGVWKLATISVVFLFPILTTLFTGTQKNVGDALIYFVIIFIVKSYATGRKISLQTVTIVFSLFVVGTIALVNILSQRYIAIDVNLGNIAVAETYHVRYNQEHPIFSVLGPELGFPIAVLTGYFTNGLNGLSYCLNLPGTWSYFLGTSYSISVIADKLFGIPFPYLDTYPHQAGVFHGWGETRWHSVFSWFASDFTFTGTVLIFGFLGYVYCRAWNEAVRFQNPYSILIFCLLSMGVVMMPANNQLMQTPGAMITLATTVFLYLRFRTQYNFQRRARS